MKRLGLRKVADSAINSKVGSATDNAINKVVTFPGVVGRKIGTVTGLTKLHKKIKIDPNKGFWNERKKANLSIQDKINQANQKLVVQDANDLAAAKEFEREHADNIKELGLDMNTEISSFASTRVKEKA